jgi:Zn-dependent membrane protease YugP
MYYLIGIVAFVGSLLVQQWLKSTYGKWAKQANAAGLSGADVARAILRENGLENVQVEEVRGTLSDHYDPRSRVVRLSTDNFQRASVSGMAVAAHEVGHAIQHATGYAPLKARSLVLPAASLGSQWGPLLAIGGIMLGMGGLAQIGVILFAAAVVFQLITLPVEFDASRRAMQQLDKLQLVTSNDEQGARSVLNAAAMTYVAAAATSIAYLVYFFLATRE